MSKLSTRRRVRVICIPDIDRPIGGVKQLYRHVEHLISFGFDAAMVAESASFRPSWFQSSAPVRSFQQCVNDGEFIDQNTILVLPETYINVDLESFNGIDLSQLPRVIFNQNAYYSYGSPQVDFQKVKNFYHHSSVLHVLCVSQDSYDFIHSCLGITSDRLSRIVNAIEPDFIPSSAKTNTFSWMPRKNPDHVHSVLTSLQNLSPSFPVPWTGQPLIDLPHKQIAHYLSSSKIFLSFGHPEGFGLPVAEAMASGCWVIGYSGLGGRELFSLNASSIIEFGDWANFSSTICSIVRRFYEHEYETSLIVKHQADAVRAIYSYENESSSINSAWYRILNSSLIIESVSHTDSCTSFQALLTRYAYLVRLLFHYALTQSCQNLYCI